MTGECLQIDLFDFFIARFDFFIARFDLLLVINYLF